MQQLIKLKLQRITLLFHLTETGARDNFAPQNMKTLLEVLTV